MSTKQGIDGQRERFAKIPRVDHVVAHPRLAAARQRLGPGVVTQLARTQLQQVRSACRAGQPAPELDEVAAQVAVRAEKTLRRRVRKVINATGVMLHTNLGRAPLSGGAVEALSGSAGHYSAIELDLSTGRRGPRGPFAEYALAQLAGAQDALVGNNNAAAVLLALTALAAGRGVVVSRGELIEIGGKFRIPDVLARSGAEMIEVGTTNRTRVSDYEQALDDHSDVALLLRVHQGNFRQTGFVERPRLAELAELAHRRGVILVKDLGGGALIDFSELGLTGEPTVASCVQAGADVVCFSCDKVLGGPQGGVLVGRAELVGKARRDPLARALRLGRLPLGALEATLASYLAGEVEQIPVIRALKTPLTEVRQRVEGWCRQLGEAGVLARPEQISGAVGGGTLAEAAVESVAAVLETEDAVRLAARLRAASVAVIARIQDDRLLLDGRSVLPGEDADLLAAVVAAFAGSE